jgi:phasin family protein
MDMPTPQPGHFELFQTEDIMQFLSDNPALRAHLESQVDFMNQFTQKAYDTLREMSEMNLKLARQIVEGSMHASQEMLNCSDPMQLTQAAIKQVQPATERLRSYQQHLLTVMAGAQAAFAHAAETSIPQATRSASAIADEMARHAGAAANVPVTGRTSAEAGGMPAAASTTGNGDASKPH